MQAFTRQQAQALGYLPHELISKRRAQFNRLLWRLSKLIGVTLQFKQVPRRPTRITPRMLRIRHAAYSTVAPEDTTKPVPYPWLPISSKFTQKDAEGIEALLKRPQKTLGVNEQVTEETATQALSETPLAEQQQRETNLHRLIALGMGHRPKPD